MFKNLAISIFCYLMSPLSLHTALGQDLSKDDSLVFRFTGPEARKLKSFLKDRTRLETDFDKTRYYGERMSLACSELDDCYLWLARKEWQTVEQGSPARSQLTFTLPLKQSTWSGQLSLAAAGLHNKSRLHLELQDLYFPGTFAFSESIDCPIVRGAETAGPLQSGDCRLELSSAPRKRLPYPASIQYTHNLDNMVVNFKGPWARKLLAAASNPEPDPHDPKRIRAQLGPELYCWNLDPLDQERFLDDTHVCQANLLRQADGSLRFTGHGSLKGNKEFSLTLKPIFRRGLLQELDLVFQSEGKEWIITHCPNYAKNAGFGQCSIFHDMKIDVGYYPIGNSVQGVAVGWGVAKQ